MLENIKNIDIIDYIYEKNMELASEGIRIDTRKLRYFLTVAKEGQVTRAAKKLNMAQPPLSQQLRIFEEELGAVLLERNRKRMELTEAGKLLYEKGEELLRQFDELMREVREAGQGFRGVLSIGTVQSCLPLLPKRIVDFRNDYPFVSFKIWEGDTSQLYYWLNSRGIEVAIVRLPVDTRDLAMIRLQDEPYVLLAPNNWDIPESTIKMERLKDFPLLFLHRTNGTGVFEMLVNECRKFGFEPNIICECPDVTVLISLVAAGLGATMIPQSTASMLPLNEIKIIALENCTLQSESAVIWLKDRYLSKAARRFIEMF